MEKTKTILGTKGASMMDSEPPYVPVPWHAARRVGSP